VTVTSLPALHAAIALAERPILARAMRRLPLPPDVLALLKIAAGDAPTCRAATAATGRRQVTIRNAAVLYIQLVVLTANADSYRVLGAAADAAQQDLREHMRWFMKWLHPDRCTSAWESAFAARVLSAWQDVKSPDRRARYDRVRMAPQHGGRAWRPAIPWIAPATTARRRRRRRVPAIAVAAAVAAGVAALLLWPNWRAAPWGSESKPVSQSVIASGGPPAK